MQYNDSLENIYVILTICNICTQLLHRYTSRSEFQACLICFTELCYFVCCLAHQGSTVGFLLLQCSSVLFDTPGISRFRSQHVVSVESSSLFHHSIYLWFICFPWWSIDGLENLHADRTTVWFEPWQKPRARPFQGGTSVLVPYCYLFFLSVFILWFSYYVSDIL